MSVLAGFQREFLAAVLGGDEPRDAGLAVHRRNILGARHDALAAAHPVTRRLVGEVFFREAAERFALATPSTSGDLHAYGGAFAEFIAAYPHARELPYLPDVARLEWAVHESQDAADGKPLDLAALARLPQWALGDLRFGLHPAVRLVSSEHAILAIWEANQLGRDGVPARDAGPDRILVRRDGLAVMPVAVQAPEWELLRALARGDTLAEACTALEDPERTFAPALVRVAALGAIEGRSSA